jgi:hypothetical protein
MGGGRRREIETEG